MQQNFKILNKQIDGELYQNKSYRTLFSTDASPYKEMPLGVCFPKNKKDIQKIIQFARLHDISLIPRGAGTSLAGQVVGDGLVVDVSKYMNKIIEFNKEEKWILVEPGLVPDTLNHFLKEHGLMFGPETSTANRCTIGGMAGNNSCGLHSLIYGSTRDHTLAITAYLSNGEEVTFSPLNKEEFESKCTGNSLENNLYRKIKEILSPPIHQQQIHDSCPAPEIPRRNTGYALDMLLDNEVFSNKGSSPFNFCKLIVGSEGTLAFITAIKLNLVSLPPPLTGLVCVHCKSLEESLRGNLIALQQKPQAIELMDKTILDLTKGNIEQNRNRFFLKDDPEAILIVEFVAHTETELQKKKDQLENNLKAEGIGYHYPIVIGEDTKKVWNLRKAGLGVLSNLKGDAKPVSFVEDTSVRPKDLPDFIKEFNLILDTYGLSCVYHAHIATGELHLRPILNLKQEKDVQLFRSVAMEVALLVKKFRGSLSGEHGDGRLRGEFIPLMVGEDVFRFMQQIKQTWDPDNIFNRGKIIDCPPMDQFLRFEVNKKTEKIVTSFNFSSSANIQLAAEQCNGSGDCLKMDDAGGTMCPSYRVTRDEKYVTRGRANLLREMITTYKDKQSFNDPELYDSMDLCLSCKACKSECPSNVDVAKLKAEFLQHYYDVQGIPLRARLFSGINTIQSIGSVAPGLYNFISNNTIIKKLIFPFIGITPKRTLPVLQRTSLSKWNQSKKRPPQPKHPIKKIYLFNDEFTNYNDTDIGIKAIQLLTSLGYEVVIPKHIESGRASLSKGLLKKAKKIADKNISYLYPLLSEDTPLVGIEPSSILTFRDEYPDLASSDLLKAAKQISRYVLTFEEFIIKEYERGNIKSTQFTQDKQHVYLHGHCHQKALTSTLPTRQSLSIPENYKVTEIPSGCCGMAGSFGYEKEHYALSMKIGEMSLFPHLRKLKNNVIVSAPGTSCRQQIKDGTGIVALHPVEVLWDALKKKQLPQAM